jgi:hypothetical protein
MNDVTRALTHAADVARCAPSIHNTQPWRLVVDGPVLEVHAEPARRLPELDPDGHMMLVSCGAALHHATTALEADGWRTEVDRVADTAGPLARIRVTGHGEPDPTAVRRLAAVPYRRTDRRPVPPTPVPAEALAAVTRAVSGTGLRIHVLRRDQVVDLAVAVDRAMRAEGTDDRQRTELTGWAGGDRPAGTGIPETSIPGSPPQTTVPGRDFGVTGTLPPGAGHDESAVYAVVFGAGDASVDWLRAGEALSAAWLDAVDRGLTLLPFSAPSEIASTRLLVQRLVSHVGYPYLVVRLGVACANPVPDTPRLPAGETLEVRS